MDHIGARRRGHGAMALSLVLALLWIPIRVVKISDTGVSFFDKNFPKMSVFLVKTLKIRWRLGALPPDPLSLRRLGASPQTLACGLPLPNPECVTDPLFLVSCFVNLSPGLSMEIGILWKSHGKCPMGWDGMGQHKLHFPWNPWDSSHVTAS